MRFFLILLTSLLFFGRFDMLNTASSQNFFLHQSCLRNIPENAESELLLRSLVFGATLKDPQLKKLLSDSALIHLIVVSGSHFIVLLWLLNILRIPSFLQFGVLFFYWLVTLVQAPGLFALLAWTLWKHNAPI